MRLADQKRAGRDDDQRGDGDDRGGAVQGPGRGQPFDKLAADKAAGHCGDVEP